GLGLAQRSCEVGVRVTPLVDGRSAITDVVEIGMTGIEAVKLGDHREFSVPTSQGRIAGYRISNGQSGANLQPVIRWRQRHLGGKARPQLRSPALVDRTNDPYNRPNTDPSARYRLNCTSRCTLSELELIGLRKSQALWRHSFPTRA